MDQLTTRYFSLNETIGLEACEQKQNVSRRVIMIDEGDVPKITHIIIIDNYQIELKLLKEIIIEYTYLLEKYTNVVDIEYLYLIITYPQYKIIKLDVYDINIDLKEIQSGVHEYNYKGNIENYKKIQKYYDETMKSHNIEMVIINGFLDITQMMGLKNATIITFDNLKKIPEDMTIITHTNLNMANIEFIKIILRTPIFLSKLIKQYKIEIEEEIWHTTRFITTKKTNIIKVNGMQKELIETSRDYKKCIAAINNSIDTLENKIEIYDEYKKIVQDIKRRNISRCSNISNKLYNMMEIIKTNKMNELEENNILVKYCKKAETTMHNKKYQTKLNETIVHNIKLIEKVDKIKEILETPSIKNFIDTAETSESFNKSSELFNSIITLSNWHEEIKSCGAMGILIKVSTSSLSKIGITHSISIDNITNTFYPVTDYINGAIIYFETNSVTFGNLNEKNLISGNAVGDGNSVLPLYINKYHWRIARIYLKPLLGIILSHHPLGYKNNHQNFVFSVLIEMTKLTFEKDRSHLNERWIQCYMGYMRTCAEISFENKYNYGIKNYLKKYLSNAVIRVTKESYAYDNMLGQIICTGYIPNNHDLVSLTIYILEESIRKVAHTLDPNNLLKDVEYKIIYHLKVLLGFNKIITIMKEIYNKLGSYNKFIQMMERNNSVIDEEITTDLYNMIESQLHPEEISIKSVYEIINKEYNLEEVMLYINQGIKHNRNKYRLKAIKNNSYIDYQKK